MSAASVTPATGDGPNARPYDTAPISRPSSAYTGDPGSRAYTPTRSLPGGESRTMTMARPSIVQSFSTPITGPVNPSGSVPCETDKPRHRLAPSERVHGEGLRALRLAAD
jgi:hypothetical protein